jgi:hypothetical protein
MGDHQKSEPRSFQPAISAQFSTGVDTAGERAKLDGPCPSQKKEGSTRRRAWTRAGRTLPIAKDLSPSSLGVR